MGLGLVLSACSGAEPPQPEETGNSQAAAIQIVVDPPPEVNCFDLQLIDNAGNMTSYPVAIAPTMTFPGISSGGYFATATAYFAEDCSVVPSVIPWATLDSTPVVVQTGVTTSLTLQLFKSGQVNVTAQFVETPEVIATNQGAVNALAAYGNQIAWTTNEPGAGTIVSFVDNKSLSDVAVVVATSQSPGDINVQPGTGDIYWTDRVAGAGGSIWRYQAGVASEVVSDAGDPYEIAASSTFVYWTAHATGSLGVFDPSISGSAQYIAGPHMNALALYPLEDPSQVVFSTSSPFGIHAMLAPVPGSVLDIYDAPAGDTHDPISVATDGSYVYWTDYQDGNGSRVLRKGLTSASEEVLFPAPGGTPFGIAYYIEVHGNYLYFVNGSAVRRLPKDGSGPLELVERGTPRGLAITSFGGATYVYWTDTGFGGLVWRARIE